MLDYNFVTKISSPNVKMIKLHRELPKTQRIDIIHFLIRPMVHSLVLPLNTLTFGWIGLPVVRR
jgi:uncharacterized membrane protein YvlD (DUF360 family)